MCILREVRRLFCGASEQKNDVYLVYTVKITYSKNDVYLVYTVKITHSKNVLISRCSEKFTV